MIDRAAARRAGRSAAARFARWVVSRDAGHRRPFVCSFLIGMNRLSSVRIVDAALNRAGEGLRVAEDFARFELDDAFLTGELKSLRHELAAAAGAVISPADRHAARDTPGDVGTTVQTASERHRSDGFAVCTASLERAKQALRSIEEYGKLFDASFAGRVEAIRYRLYTVEKSLDVGRASRQRLAGVRLCVLIDGRRDRDEFTALAAALVGAGVGMIQLRDKRLSDLELLDRAGSLCRIARGSRREPAEGAGRPATLCIVNDRADIAAAAGADGVHLGQDDLPVRAARSIVGPRRLVGVSTHELVQARQAVLDGANYLGAGPTFPSQTKSFEQFAGLDYLGEVAAEIRLPTFAIGGITQDNLPDVLATGITRVAMGAAVATASVPASIVKACDQILKSSAFESIE